MSTYLIVESDKNLRKNLIISLHEIDPLCNIQETDCVEEAILAYIIKKPNLVFLSVDFTETDGFELIHELIELGEKPRVAIISKNEQNALKALRSNAVDFLSKPIKQNDIQFCINRVRCLEEAETERQKMSDLFLHLKMNHRIRINTRVGFEIIKSEDILYCEADGNYTNICLMEGKKQTTSTTLGCVIKQLPDDHFFRIGRSVVINLDYLKSVNRKEKICQLQVEGRSIELPLSNSRVQQLAEIF
jgi:two-component system LytT family response regulator